MNFQLHAAYIFVDTWYYKYLENYPQITTLDPLTSICSFQNNFHLDNYFIDSDIYFL